MAKYWDISKIECERDNDIPSIPHYPYVSYNRSGLSNHKLEASDNLLSLAAHPGSTSGLVVGSAKQIRHYENTIKLEN